LHIIYHCCEGCYSSATAAAIHLDLLPMDRKPSYHDLINVPFYDNLKETDRGKIILRGTDEIGNKVYTLSRKYIPHIILPAIIDLWRELEQNENDLMLVNTQYCVNRGIKTGGFLSKRLNITSLGKPLTAKATLHSYYKIANIVKQTKQSLS